MKLTLHSFEDLERLLALLGPKGVEVIGDRSWEPLTGEQLLADLNTAQKHMDENRRMARGETVEGRLPPVERIEPLPIERVEPETESSPSRPEEAAAAPELDADGRRWDARIDSSNRGLNKDGTWRARRNHGLTEDEVTGIKAELMKEANDAAEAADNTMGTPDDASAVTETHPLPVDEPEAAELDAANADAALQATFFELVEQARKPAEDIQKDDIATTLQAAQAFTKAHSPHAFRLLRETITDKTLPGMTPGERRVLLAAMELYKPAGEA